MKKLNFNHLLAFFSICVLPASLSAQIYVDADNEVGIGTLTPSAKLHIVTTGTLNGTSTTVYNEYSGTGSKIGLLNMLTIDGSGTRYGIYNNLYGPSSPTNPIYGMYNYIPTTNATATGVHNYVTQGSLSTNYVRGIYNDIVADGMSTAFGEYTNVASGAGSAGNRYGNYINMGTGGIGTKYGVTSLTLGSANYAGYFAGNVLVAGVFSNPSDARTKQNVRQIQGALATVERLQPRTYEYRQDLGLGLPEGQQFGFVAQDMEQVLPQLVKNNEALIVPSEAEMRAKHSADGTIAQEPLAPKTTQIKSVNYIGLIPVLTQAIQELSAKVDAQASTIARLESELQQR